MSGTSACACCLEAGDALFEIIGTAGHALDRTPSIWTRPTNKSVSTTGVADLRAPFQDNSTLSGAITGQNLVQVTVEAAFSDADGNMYSSVHAFELPLSLFAQIVAPVKSNAEKLTLAITEPPAPVITLFEDLAESCPPQFTVVRCEFSPRTGACWLSHNWCSSARLQHALSWHTFGLWWGCWHGNLTSTW